MDLSKMSRSELAALQKRIDKELETRREKEKEEAIQQIQEIAKNAGFPVEELLASRKRQRKSSKVKYRDPEDPTNTWAGRGRKPKWLEEALKKGKSLDDFAV